MTISDAVITKLKSICDEKKITINRLAGLCGITQSTLENIVSGNSKNPKLSTIIRICHGLNISLYEFFSDPVFSKIDRDDT